MRRTPQRVVHLLDDLEQTELAGDLAEELSAGRSRGWFWWQVRAAIIAALFATIRKRPYLTFSAVAVGWTTLVLVEVRVRGGLSLLSHEFPRWVWDGPVFLVAWSCAPLAVAAAAYFVSGWVVARVHRQRRLALVLITMLSMALTNASMMAWRTYFILTHPIAYPPLLERISVLKSAIFVLLPLMVAVGGWFPGTGNAAGDRRARVLGEAHGDGDVASAVDQNS